MKTKLADHDQFMTTEEVLEYLQVNLQTVYRLIRRRNIPAIRFGRQWRFRRGDIEAWLETQRATTAQPELPPSARPNGRPRLLLVDDEPSSLDVLTKMASEYAIVSATHAAGALEMLRTNPAGYDMPISDLNMPTMSGLALIREVRQIAPRLPIAIVTGYSSESSAIEAINLGVGGYLVKPFRAADVMAVVARALSVPAA